MITSPKAEYKQHPINTFKPHYISMKQICSLFLTLLATLPLSAETITAHYYGSEIDLSQKHNPCKGNTNGGVEVIVTTTVTSIENAPNRTVVTRTYSLPNGKVLKQDKEIINSPKHKVLAKLHPHTPSN